MKNKTLKDKSIKKLKSELKGLKTIIATNIGLLLLVFGVKLNGLFWRDKRAAFEIGILIAFLLSCILLDFFSMKKIQGELNIRNYKRVTEKEPADKKA